MADDSRNCRNCYPVSDTDVQVKCLVHYYSTTTTAATTTTKKCQDYSATITQLRGHFTRFTSKTVAQLNADIC